MNLTFRCVLGEGAQGDASCTFPRPSGCTREISADVSSIAVVFYVRPCPWIDCSHENMYKGCKAQADILITLVQDREKHREQQDYTRLLRERETTTSPGLKHVVSHKICVVEWSRSQDAAHVRLVNIGAVAQNAGVENVEESCRVLREVTPCGIRMGG
jgi:hypothetical protein